MTEEFEVDLSELQPSQLYICADKLAEVVQTPGGPALDPVPVRRLGPRTVLTDGHTRAFAAFRAGRSRIAAYWETDELDWEAYEICVRWCDEAGIRSIADLADRVVAAEDYEELWYERCRAMHRELQSKRELRSGTVNGCG